MAHQKKIALINDVTGFGRCSVAVELPLISALKVQACVLPTAILSVHTGFHDFYLDDYTDRMEPYIDSWRKNHLTFDGINTGFLGSVRQIEIVLQFIHEFKQEGTTVIVDPVMGDNGHLYPSYTEDMCREMRRLLGCADVLTPNLTEACQLLDVPYRPDTEISDAELLQMAQNLASAGPNRVVLTGLHRGSKVGNFLYEKGQELQWVLHEKIGSDRSGTGDVFAAIVSAAIVKGESLYDSVEKAANFIAKCMTYTETLDLPHNCGLAFEEYLTTLR